ncbi:MAG TPA: hypothetical protein VK668_13920 [Mucilaginibacter sp.]|nr:hypothetical protein [Mucilaginibacter sp.]
MKYKITAVLLIIVIVSSSFSRFFIFAGFELNKSYIATKLCENRNRPWMHCNGKCYLMKKIKQAEDKQNNAERESQKNLVQESYCEAIPEVKFYTQLLQVIAIPNNRIELPQGHNAIFQPPQLG